MGDTVDDISSQDMALDNMSKDDLIRLRVSILNQEIERLDEQIELEKDKRDLLYKIGAYSVVGGSLFAVLSTAYCALTNQSADTSTLLFCNSGVATGCSFAALAVSGIIKSEKIGKLRDARKYATYLRDQSIESGGFNPSIRIYDDEKDSFKRLAIRKKLECEFRNQGLNIEKPKMYIKK